MNRAENRNAVSPQSGVGRSGRTAMMPGVLSRYIARRYTAMLALILLSIGLVILLISYVDVLRHFHDVLRLDPHNGDATSEIRVLEQRLGGRKR